MLYLWIDEQAGEEAEAPLEELLRTDSCSGAAETLKAFSACGTSVQAISGEPRLTRGGRDEGEAATWGKTGDGRERREREGPTPELATSSLVYLPAIPSWLPLWGLLSPTDAVSDGGGEGGDRGNRGNTTSESAFSSSDKRMAELDTGSPDESVFGKAGSGSCEIDSKHGDEGGQDEGGQIGGVQDALSTLRTGLGRLAMTDGEKSGGGGRKGAVRLVQTVASPLAPYRYAAVLHFWDVHDAASFVDRFNGLCLPDRAVMKALFLSGVEVIAAGGSGRHAGSGAGGANFGPVNFEQDDIELSTLRRQKRRSLSEGVSSAITKAATAAASLRGGGGSEEFKSSWSGGKGGGSGADADAAFEGEGPPDLIPSRDPGDVSVYLSGAADVRRRGRGVARSTTAEAAAGDPLPGVAGRRDGYGLRLRNRRSESASPSPPVREMEAEETKGRGGGGGDGGNVWRRDEAFRETFDSLSPPPGLQGGEVFMALSGGDRGGRWHRAKLTWGEEAGSAASRDHSHDLKGGGGGGAGGKVLSRQIELPPCPVCFDRLDPAVSGIPVARARPGARGSGSGSGGDTGVAYGIASNASRCNHRECKFRGEAPAGKGKPAAGVDEVTLSEPQSKGSDLEGGGCCCGSDIEPFGGDTGCTTHHERGSKRGRASATAAPAQAEESRGPRWEGESARERGARQHEEGGAVGGIRRGGGGGPALNTVIWKGSTCRVCRSLNVALEGAPDEMCCETCRIAHNLWICMVCGHIGCGRYTKEHAKEHFCLSGHSYSLELSTGRVWDYTGDCYAHRALRGHLASSSSHERGAIGRNEYGHNGRRESQDHNNASASQGGAKGAGGAAAAAAAGSGSGGRDGSLPLYSEGPHDAFGEQGDPSSLKVAVVSREYEALVARQLQEQQRYFEDLIATAIAADAEANAPTEEVLTEEERREVADLRQAVEGLSDKYDAILDSLREDEETARRVRAENRGLVAEQRHQKQEEARLIEEARQTKRQCEEQMAELEGQMQDLLFFLKAQEEVKSGPRREELVGGSVVMGEGSAGSSSSGHGRGGGKETERERLARRLKERSHSRRVGSKGAKPGR